MSKLSMDSSKPMARRGIGTLLLLVGAIFFFFLVTGREISRSSHSTVSSHLRRQTSIENHTTKTSIKSIALGFGNQNHSPNFPYLISPQSHDKRDNADTYEYCLCKGRKLYTDIGLTAFGIQQSTGVTFTYDQFDSAWMTEPQTARFEPTFNKWAQDTIGRSIRDDRVNRTKTVQNKAYISVGGAQMPATGGSYEVLYTRSAGTIIAHSISSPTNILTHRGVPNPANALPPSTASATSPGTSGPTSSYATTLPPVPPTPSFPTVTNPPAIPLASNTSATTSSPTPPPKPSSIISLRKGLKGGRMRLGQA
ncbi:MAG: hypothetical protein L6R37_004276 [Teloschistes peruensis]|nr:MAG: hypothetical protein L6R37_004276 [Teloschistes peruensis]